VPREWLDGSLDGFLPEHLIDLTLAFHAENSEWTSRPRHRFFASWPPEPRHG
jgi:hypothetical protein